MGPAVSLHGLLLGDEAGERVIGHKPWGRSERKWLKTSSDMTGMSKNSAQVSRSDWLEPFGSVTQVNGVSGVSVVVQLRLKDLWQG